MKKNKIKIILIVLTILIIASLVVKNDYDKFVDLKNSIISYDNIPLSECVQLFILKEDRPPINIHEFYNFVKIKNIELHKQLKRVNLHYLRKDNNEFYFYINGFDNKNDSLKKHYLLKDINYLKSFFVKGDVAIPICNTILEFNANVINKIHRVSLKKTDLFRIWDIYEAYLNCNRIRTKGIIQEDNLLQLRIQNKNIKTLENGYFRNLEFGQFSDKTKGILLKYIKDSEFYKIKDTVFIISIKGVNIEQVECF